MEIITFAAHPMRDKALMRLAGYGGYDVGKARHPSHFTVLFPEDERHERFIQIASVWFDVGTPYTVQVERLKALMRELNVSVVSYDATRGELEAMREQGLLAGFNPVMLTPETRARIAGKLALALEQGRLVLLNDERQYRSMLSVNALLQSQENEAGHADAFWSNALALDLAWPGAASLIKRIRKGV